jgi:hypothetical protein
VEAHFFEIQKPVGLIQKPSLFYVHITHSPILEIIWIQNFTANKNENKCKYEVQQLIRINNYLQRLM